MRPRNFLQKQSIHCHHRRQPNIPGSQRAISCAKRPCSCASHSQTSKSRQRPLSRNSQKSQEAHKKSRMASRCEVAPPNQAQPAPINSKAKSVARLYQITQEQSKRIVELIQEKGELLCQNRRMEAMLANPAMRREQEYHQEHMKRQQLSELKSEGLSELKREIVNIKNSYEQRIEELTKNCGYPEVNHLELNTPEKSQSFKTKNTQQLDESYGVSLLQSKVSLQNQDEGNVNFPLFPITPLPFVANPSNRLTSVPNIYFTKASRLSSSVKRVSKLYDSSKEIRFVSPQNGPSNGLSNLMNGPANSPCIPRPQISPFSSATQPNITPIVENNYSSNRMIHSTTILPLRVYGGYQPGGNVFRVSANGTLEPYVRESVERNPFANK